MLVDSNLKLHKTASNSHKVMEAFPADERAKDLKDLDLTSDDLPLHRSLGILWNLETDSFTFQVSEEERPYTKRGVLATINSLYDPLGFVAPITMQGKALLRELSAEQNNWDEPLPSEKQEEWIRWKESLKDLQRLQIPRCYVLAVELYELVRDEIDINMDAVKFFTDSKIVLGYIHNSTRRFYTYVANRVIRIRKSSHPDQWHYISTENNPADHATRPIHASHLQHTTWLSSSLLSYLL